MRIQKYSYFIMGLLIALFSTTHAMQMQIDNETTVDFPTLKVAPPMSPNLGPLKHNSTKTISIPNPDAFVIYIASTRYRVQFIKTADDPTPYCEYPLVSDFPCKIISENEVMILPH